MNRNSTTRIRRGAVAFFAVLLVVPMVSAAPQAVEIETQTDDAPEASQLAPQGRGCEGCGGCGGCGAISRGEPGRGQRGRGGGCGRYGAAKAVEGGRGMQGGRGPGGGGRAIGGHRPEMRNAHALIAAHGDIERRVEELPGGVRTVTTTTNPELVPVLREHVAEMAAMIEGGGRIRNWDPLFSTIFDHSDAIEMEIEEIENGVAVVETSADPKVAALIRAHAYKVDDFVARGQEAYREATPLPEEWAADAAETRSGAPCGRGSF